MCQLSMVRPLGSARPEDPAYVTQLYQLQEKYLTQRKQNNNKVFAQITIAMPRYNYNNMHFNQH